MNFELKKKEKVQTKNNKKKDKRASDFDNADGAEAYK